MLVSMTGFGQGEVSNRTSRVTVEIRTVNHRYFDLSVKIPKTLAPYEHEIKDLLKEKIRRGRVSLTVSVETEQPDYAVKINVPLMEQYVNQLQQFAGKHSLGAMLDINTLATLPEVFHLAEHERKADELWPMVKRGLKQAVTSCTKMRQDEGRALESDIRARIAAMNRLVKKVEKRAPKVVAHHKRSLKERIGKMMEGVRIEKDRMITEIALMADRLDFTEEIIRLQSHLAQIKACLDQGGGVGKKLTYLLQEVHREATTIASKASDAEVIEHTVSLREESERLREQVQNLE
jgi:uncharacterized protein (TIGR00255 family)